MKKSVSGIMLSLLLICTLTLAFNVQPVKAQGTIYIRADGSIDPPTAPITTVNNVTYTLTDNITSDADGIVVERSNIIIDGAGYTIRGIGSGNGLDLSGRSNVTIKNMAIEAFNQGIWLAYSSNNSISGNNITNSYDDIVLSHSANYNSISGNNLAANNGYDIVLYLSLGNSICGNNITNNHYVGIWLDSSSNNSISGNNIYSNMYGICLLYSSSNNSIYHNNFVNNTQQVSSYESINVWDDGYPSGGNYWSDYAGIDVFSGPYQNITSYDGIGDTPYIIDANNTDRYPLMNPWPHDNALVNATPFMPYAWKGIDSVKINVTVANQGIYTENVSIVIFSAYPIYPTLEQSGTFWSMGDVNKDGYIDQLDVDLIGKWFGYSDHSPADINGDGVVNMKDLSICALNYGRDIYTFFSLTPKPVARQEAINLPSGASATVTLVWNTTGFAIGNYTIWAYAWPIPGETDTADNLFTDGWVYIAMIGDLGGGTPPQFFKFDGRVDAVDLALFVKCLQGTAPPEAMYLADLGSIVSHIPKYFQFDGNVTGADEILFLYYYRGLGQYVIGDLGGGTAQFFACDGVVGGPDLGLFLLCYHNNAPAEAMELADLGGGVPPTFFQYDGKVDGKDLSLFLACYHGHGPPPVDMDPPVDP